MTPFRLLFVDDSEKVRTDAGEFLRPAGYAIDVAVDTASALRAVDQVSYDLIFTSAENPAIACAIRRRESLRGGATAFIVALADADGPRERQIDHGCDACDRQPSSRAAYLALAARWTVGRGADPAFRLEDLQPEYLASRRRDAARLRECLMRAEFKELGAFGHRLRGSGGTYGFRELSAIGDELERAARACDASGTGAALDHFEAELCRLVPPSANHPTGTSA